MGSGKSARQSLQVDGQSHVVHSEEEALGTRLTIDSLTCLLANETDPSKLLAISPGKLMRYLVPDESTVVQDQPYAEIEVRLQLSVTSQGPPVGLSFQCPQQRWQLLEIEMSCLQA